jgi:GWxTD domain-containing protein
VNKKHIVPLCFLLIVAFCLPCFSQKKLSPKDLPPRFRKWLQEEVVYIITAKEKDVFLQLESDREREIFIEAFWKARDPDPDTPDNEFKKEHYRRITYVNQWFGREGPGEGWRTDMGRIYILLGEPRSVDRIENDSEIYPVIIWFYQGMAEYGLPDSFNVVFFKKSGMGQYELYSPVKYGPQSLLIHYKGDPADYLSAYNELYGIDPTVAAVSLTLIPGESGQSVSPSIASEVLVSAKIPSLPQAMVKDSYAEKLLKYKDIIEVDYTANYIESDTSVEIIRDPSGMAFVHYLIEPSKLTFEQVGDRFRARLEVTGKVADLQGRTVYQFDRSVPIDFDRSQLESIKAKLFSFQDMFPLVQGNYRLSLLLKNTVSKEFTSAEKDLTVPGPSGLRLSPLLLAPKAIRGSEYRGKNKPFLVGDVQFVPSPRNDFSRQDTLYLYFQASGLTGDLRENGILEYSILRGEEKILSVTKNVRDYPDQTNFVEEFPLADLSPAYYKIQVSLLDREKKEILSGQSDFFITPQPVLPRPWVLSFPMPPSRDPLYANLLGNQFLNKGDTAKARELLAEAYNRNPRSSQFALDYCRLLLAAKEYLKVREVALPFLEGPEKYEFLAPAGQASQSLGQLAEAISYYKEYLGHYGTSIQVLNSIGECYYELGDFGEALTAWEKSLEISPGQESIKKMVDAIKEKK